VPQCRSKGKHPGARIVDARYSSTCELALQLDPDPTLMTFTNTQALMVHGNDRRDIVHMYTDS
jgi:hypothetical protein